MNWQDWVLIYLVCGVAFVLIRAIQENELSDIRDILLSVFIFPIFPFSYAWYRWQKRKREITRQAHITEQVNSGKYSPEQAKEWFGWNG